MKLLVSLSCPEDKAVSWYTSLSQDQRSVYHELHPDCPYKEAFSKALRTVPDVGPSKMQPLGTPAPAKGPGWIPSSQITGVQGRYIGVPAPR